VLRITLFLATNLAVLMLMGITFSVLGVDRALEGYGVGLPGVLFFAALFGMGGAFLSLLMSKGLARHAARVRVIEQPRTAEEQWLYRTVEALAREAGIGMPEVGVFDAAQPNAFATGWSRDEALVAVSTGLLRSMRQDEVRAVLAHEIGHVANGDMVTLALVQGVVNTFVIAVAWVLGRIVAQAVFRDSRSAYMGEFAVRMVMQAILGMFAMAIVMWFSRYREYRADAAGAHLAGTGAMIAALQRLKGGAAMPEEMPASLQAFGINQGLRGGMQALFASHPPLDDRIEALQRGPR
jgi:heat shock protein HtpX